MDRWLRLVTEPPTDPTRAEAAMAALMAWGLLLGAMALGSLLTGGR